MAERAIRKPAERDRVWTALKSFWQTYPGYDPDDLAAQFRPMPEFDEELEDYATLVLTPIEVEEPAPFDVSLLDQLDALDESAADDVFSPDHMAAVAADLDADPRTITFTEAEQAGILDWQN